MPRIQKKVQQGYPTFRKKSGKVTGLFKKCLPKLPDVSKIVRQSHGLFKKSSPELPVFSKNDRIASGEGVPPPGPVNWG
jgi:hypothetical protein